MPVVGLALLLVGYAFLYSGASNLAQGDKGWGFLESLLGPNFNKGQFKGANTKLASFTPGGSSPTPGGKSPVTQGTPQAGTPAATAPGPDVVNA